MRDLILRLDEYRALASKANVLEKIKLADKATTDTLALVSAMAERIEHLEAIVFSTIHVKETG